MSRPQRKNSRETIRVNVNRETLQFCTLQIELLESIAQEVVNQAARTVQTIVELKEQFEDIEVMVRTMLGEGNNTKR